jgi:hypothetical protein
MTLAKKLTLSTLTFAILTSTSSMAFSAGKKDVSKVFEAPYETIVVATKAALIDLKLKNKGEKSLGDKTIVYFSRPVTGFSWGERGTISIVSQTSGNTKVTVGSKKINPVQITGKNTKRFARDIFAAIQARLN